MWWLCALILLSISFIFFLKQTRISQIVYLDQKLWSVAYTSQNAIHRLAIIKIIDYQIFIVVYFEGGPTKIAIIWYDQLPIQQWKRIKVLEKLY